jgi:hypothetical protein
MHPLACTPASVHAAHVPPIARVRVCPCMHGAPQRLHHKHVHCGWRVFVSPHLTRRARSTAAVVVICASVSCSAGARLRGVVPQRATVVCVGHCAVSCTAFCSLLQRCCDAADTAAVRVDAGGGCWPRHARCAMPCSVQCCCCCTSGHGVAAAPPPTASSSCKLSSTADHPPGPPLPFKPTHGHRSAVQAALRACVLSLHRGSLDRTLHKGQQRGVHAVSTRTHAHLCQLQLSSCSAWHRCAQ